MSRTAKNHLLLVVAGISPAIITEAFYKLHIEEKTPIREVWVMTTEVGKRLIVNQLFGKNGAFETLCREYGIRRETIKFDASTIVVARDERAELLHDVREDHENQVFPDRLMDLVQQLTARPKTTLHACLSGGRKSMSFYLGAILMMFARKSDELIHVIISRELELCRPAFYYPTPQKFIGKAVINGETFRCNYQSAEIIIARIPFLKLRNKLAFPEQGLSYRTLVNLLQQNLDHLPDERIDAYPGVYPRSHAMRDVLQRARLFPGDEAILISGESGVGKEVLAKYLHNLTPGPRRPFKAVNLGAERADLINAHLFGYLRGAFTGANRDTPGFFDAAKGGTLFLDEIDKLSKSAQAILLRVLQEKRYLPVGSTTEKTVACRILIGANQDLAARVRTGHFLEDLLYRIEAFHLTVPPLRDRLADILPLANHFMRHYSRKYHKSFVDMDEALENFMLKYEWPGNVRRLENIIKKLVAMNEGFTLEYEFLDDAIRNQPAPRKNRLDRKIREFIIATLRDTDGNIKEAAKLLGMNYTTLHSRIQKLGIKPRQL